MFGLNMKIPGFGNPVTNSATPGEDEQLDTSSGNSKKGVLSSFSMPSMPSMFRKKVSSNPRMSPGNTDTETKSSSGNSSPVVLENVNGFETIPLNAEEGVFQGETGPLSSTSQPKSRLSRVHILMDENSNSGAVLPGDSKLIPSLQNNPLFAVSQYPPVVAELKEQKKPNPSADSKPPVVVSAEVKPNPTKVDLLKRPPEVLVLTREEEVLDENTARRKLTFEREFPDKVEKTLPLWLAQEAKMKEKGQSEEEIQAFFDKFLAPVRQKKTAAKMTTVAPSALMGTPVNEAQTQRRLEILRKGNPAHGEALCNNWMQTDANLRGLDTSEEQIEEAFETLCGRYKIKIPQKSLTGASVSSKPVVSSPDSSINEPISLKRKQTLTPTPEVSSVLVEEASSSPVYKTEERIAQLEKVIPEMSQTIEKWKALEESMKQKGSAEEEIHKLFRNFLMKSVAPLMPKTKEFNTDEIEDALYNQNTDNTIIFTNLSGGSPSARWWKSQGDRLNLISTFPNRESEGGSWWSLWEASYQGRRTDLLEVQLCKKLVALDEKAEELKATKAEQESLKSSRSQKSLLRLIQKSPESLDSKIAKLEEDLDSLSKEINEKITQFDSENDAIWNTFFTRFSEREDFQKRVKEVLFESLKAKGYSDIYINKNFWSVWEKIYESNKLKTDPGLERLWSEFHQNAVIDLVEKIDVDQKARKVQFLQDFPVVGGALWEEWEKEFNFLKFTKAPHEIEKDWKDWTVDAKLSTVMKTLIKQDPSLRKAYMDQVRVNWVAKGFSEKLPEEEGLNLKIAAVVAGLLFVSSFKVNSSLSLPSLAVRAVVSLAGGFAAAKMVQERSRQNPLKGSWDSFVETSQLRDLVSKKDSLSEICQSFEGQSIAEKRESLNRVEALFILGREFAVTRDFDTSFGFWMEINRGFEKIEASIHSKKENFQSELLKIRKARSKAVIALLARENSFVRGFPQMISEKRAADHEDAEKFYLPHLVKSVRPISQSMLGETSGYSGIFAILLEAIRDNPSLGGKVWNAIENSSSPNKDILKGFIDRLTTGDRNLEAILSDNDAVIKGASMIRRILMDKIPEKDWTQEGREIQGELGLMTQEWLLKEVIAPSANFLPKTVIKYIAEAFSVSFNISDEKGESLIGDAQSTKLKGGLALEKGNSHSYIPYLK